MGWGGGVDWSTGLRVKSRAVRKSLTNQVCSPRVSHTQESLSAPIVDSEPPHHRAVNCGGREGGKRGVSARNFPARNLYYEYFHRQTDPHTHFYQTSQGRGSSNLRYLLMMISSLSYNQRMQELISRHS